MGTLQIGAENAPGNVGVTTANGGGVVGFNGVTFSQAALRQGLWGYRIDNLAFSGSPTFVQSLDTDVTSQAVSASNTCRVRIYFRVSTLPPSGSYGNILTIQNASNTDSVAWVQVQSNGTLVLRDRLNTVIGGTASGLVIAVNTWYRLELNIAPSNVNSANSRILVWCGQADTAPRAISDATSWYVYSSTWNAFGASTGPGIGRVRMGKIGEVAWTGLFDFDDLAFDNSAWTNTPSTWWGKATNIVSDPPLFRATPALAISGSSVRVQSDVFTPRATPALALTASPIQKAGALVFAATGDQLIVGPSVSRQYQIAASALAALAVAGTAPRNYVLPVQGVPAMVVNSAGLQKSASLALAAAAALVDGGFRGQSSSVSMAAAANALYGPGVDVRSALAMSGQGMFAVAVDRLWQDFFLARINALAAVGSLRVASPGLAVRVVPALATAGRLDQSRALAVRATPILLVAGRKDLSTALAAAAVARLTVGGNLILTRTLAMGVIARMIHFGANIGEIRTYDNVLAIILSQGVSARLFEAGRLAELLDNGTRLADLLGGPFQAVPLPSGMLAVIQD